MKNKNPFISPRLILFVILFMPPEIGISQQANWGKSGVFWPIMTYESAFIGNQNNFITQIPDYFAIGAIRYVISDSGNTSYSLGVGLANLQFGIQKNLLTINGRPVNVKLSGGAAGALSFNIDGKINIGVFKNNIFTVSTAFAVGGHTRDFFKILEEQYLQTDLYTTYKFKSYIEFGIGMGISNISFTKKVRNQPFSDRFTTVHSQRITWQLAGTITYILGSK